MEKPIIIAGAGPVGLTLALLLHKAGHPVKVYEAVSELKPLGVGINLLPHSVRVLHQLGLEDALNKIAVRTSALHYYNKFGQRVWAEPRGLDAGYQYPQYSIHRGKLQLLLFNEVIARLGTDAVLTSHKLESWDNTNKGITANFKQANGQTVSLDGRCLIAADGINSVARKTLYPNEGDPIYGGRILWRGTTLAPKFLDGKTMFMAGHQDCKFVAYPIGEEENGRLLTNWIAELSVPDWKPEVQDWNRAVDVAKFKTPFEDWKFAWVDIPSIIENGNDVYEFPLSDRDPLPSWRDDKLMLIGDAAHPMYPIGSNGASQGILDAEKMSIEISACAALADAFDNYENERRPATSKIVLLNRQNGPEQVMQLAEERAPQGFDNIESVIPHSELEEIASRYKQTAGFTVDAVNR